MNIFVPFGTSLPREASLHIPVVVLDGIGTLKSDLPDLVEATFELQTAMMDFRPIFVVDSNDLGLFRRRGYMVEYVMPPEKWAAIGLERDWERYRHDRLTEIVGFHRPRRVLPLSAIREYRRHFRSLLD